MISIKIQIMTSKNMEIHATININNFLIKIKQNETESVTEIWDSSCSTSIDDDVLWLLSTAYHISNHFVSKFDFMSVIFFWFFKTIKNVHAKTIMKKQKFKLNYKANNEKFWNIHKHSQKSFVSPIELEFLLLDNDIDRPAEFPDNTFDECSMPRILKLIGCDQLLRSLLALVLGSNDNKSNFLATPSFVSGMSEKMNKFLTDF